MRGGDEAEQEQHDLCPFAQHRDGHHGGQSRQGALAEADGIADLLHLGGHFAAMLRHP